MSKEGEISMTLDEAIKHATEVADRYDELIKTDNHGWGFNGSDENCVKCANEHRQLAEWLIELKGLKASANRGADEHPISYAHCANAMLKMWIDKVLTDGEYSRIMDRLNAYELRKRKNHE